MHWQGTEVIEENWYLIQTEVLPFSTELDTKRGISTNCMWVFYAGIFTVVLFIPGMRARFVKLHRAPYSRVCVCVVV